MVTYLKKMQGGQGGQSDIGGATVTANLPKPLEETKRKGGRDSFVSNKGPKKKISR